MEKNQEDTNINISLMAGQKLMVGFDGQKFNSDLEFLISELKIGGIVLFSRNIDSPEQLKTLLRKIKEFSNICELPKPFVAIDQEGGEVARLKEPFIVFKGNPYIKNKNDAQAFAKTQAFELNELGINMNFAPVLDVIPKHYKSIMQKRAFNGDAKKVAELGSYIIETFQAFNTIAVAKHFPGIGRTFIDSHFERPTIDRSIEQLFEEELIPFENAIQSNVSGIMLSHIMYSNIDPEWQASLSPKIAKNLLRKKMNFNGLIMTDDLDMKSVNYDIKTCAKQILLSDIDMVLICHKGPDIENMFYEFKELIIQNKIFLESAKRALKRIIDIKNKYLSK
jgi:beta-N-acetylhexosaminidase